MNKKIDIFSYNSEWQLYSDLIAKSFFSIDLQLFAKAEDEGRTEEATEYKKRKAREEEGKVVKSVDLISAIVLISSFFTIWLLGEYLIGNFLQLFKSSYSNLSNFSIQNFTITESILSFILPIIKIAGPIILVALIFSILSHIIQFGFLFSPKLLKFDFSRILPKMNRIFGPQSKQNFVKSIVKIILIGGIAYFVLIGKFNELLRTVYMHPQKGFTTILNITFLIIMIICFSLLAFSSIDYIWQKKEYGEQLKMSRYEFKEELKETEMDPNIKRRLREKHIELMKIRTIEEKVPQADVVIRNPEHFAIALMYKKGMEAPLVLAKGINEMALRIISIAEKNDIYIYEDKELAQTLYYTTREGEEIPDDYELFKALANIFTLLYKLGRFKF